MTIYLAAIGAKALWLTYGWLISSIASAYISDRKGFGEKVGLASGLLTSVAGLIFWLVYPAKPESRWKLQGIYGRKGKTVAEARAEREAADAKGS